MHANFRSKHTSIRTRVEIFLIDYTAMHMQYDPIEIA